VTAIFLKSFIEQNEGLPCMRRLLISTTVGEFFLLSISPVLL
jgi:hypothetical protein